MRTRNTAPYSDAIKYIARSVGYDTVLHQLPDGEERCVRKLAHDPLVVLVADIFRRKIIEVAGDVYDECRASDRLLEEARKLWIKLEK